MGGLCYTEVMKKKTQILLFSVVAILIAVGLAAGFWSQRETADNNRAKIIELGSGVCTADVPTSVCSGYEVTVELADGSRAAYKVAGFSDGNSQLYDDVASKLRSAQEQDRAVDLEVNDKGEITAVR